MNDEELERLAKLLELEVLICTTIESTLGIPNPKEFKIKVTDATKLRSALKELRVLREIEKLSDTFYNSVIDCRDKPDSNVLKRIFTESEEALEEALYSYKNSFKTKENDK